MNFKHSWQIGFMHIAESLILLLVMGAILAICAYLIWGMEIMWLVLVSSLLILIVAPSVTPYWIMHSLGAVKLDRYSFPRGIDLVEQLANKAQLNRPPELFYIGDTSLNAFSVGNAEKSAIAISDGLFHLIQADFYQCFLKAHRYTETNN